MITERMKELAGMQLLTEAEIPKKLQDEINEFAKNQTTYKRLESEAKKLKSRNKELAKTIEPVISEMEDRIAETDEAIVRLKRKSSERESAKYKAAFELALTKVNAATRKILEEALEETKEVSQVAASWDAVLKEGRISDMIKRALQAIKKKFNELFRSAKSLERDTKKLLSMV